MSDKFSSEVRRIADQYINSILFVDEQAFAYGDGKDSPDKQKSLDVSSISHVFSNSGKICGFYAPMTIEDIDFCKILVLKPDIVVLDWDIKINVAYSKEEESQDDDTDDRGRYSLELLRTIVDDAGNEKLKVVFIYTGEPGINVVLDVISKALGKRFQKNEAHFEVYSNNVHILVRIKPNSKVEHTGFEHFQVAYSDLPHVLIDTFSNYVNGLMPCFAMSSLTALRTCAASVLNVYNSELDGELLGHQLALDNPNDAKTYLANSFGAAVSELILDNPSINTDQWVEGWIDSRISPEGDKVTIVSTDVKRTPTSAKEFYNKRMEFSTLKDSINASFCTKIEAGADKLKLELSKLFHQPEDNTERAKFNFAALAHHKNVFSSHILPPILTLGTIIKNKQDNFFLCIQQRCDTARVPIEGMDYLFLPLTDNKTSKKVFGAIAIGPGDIRYVVQSSSNTTLLHFCPEKANSPVSGTKIEGRYIFKSTEDEFEWVNELKDIVAQRIVAAYTSHFARVGVDEAEWLRIEGSNK